MKSILQLSVLQCHCKSLQGTQGLFLCQKILPTHLITRKVHTPSYKRDVGEEEANQPVYKYVGKRHKRYNRIHVCGLTVTGALGVLSLPLPNKRSKLPAIHQQPYPYRLLIEDIDKVRCGYGYSIFASKFADTIKLWGCGINTDSQLGFHRNHNPKDPGKSYQYIMEPSPMPLPIKDSAKTKVIDVSCGRAHTVVLTNTHGVFTMGNNAFGQCGRPIIEGEIYEGSSKVHHIPHEYFSSPIVEVVCGMDHTLFLTESGQVFACGWGADGQTGIGSLETRSEPTLLEGDIKGVKIIQICSFADTTLALSEDNQVFAWGSSEYGQLGSVTNSTQVFVPKNLPFTKQGKITQVAAGGSASALLNENGEVWVWGYGILGKGPELQNSIWPRKIPPTLFGLSDYNPNVSVVKVRCGMSNFAAITNTGEIYSWGKNKSGCLGIGSYRDQYFPWKVILGSEVVDVACGVDHMLILSKNLL